MFENARATSPRTSNSLSVRLLPVSFPEDVYFSNYQGVNGVMVPFSIMDTVNGQQPWAVHLSSMQFNTGLTDSDFAM